MRSLMTIFAKKQPVEVELPVPDFADPTLPAMSAVLETLVAMGRRPDLRIANPALRRTEVAADAAAAICGHAARASGVSVYTFDDQSARNFFLYLALATGVFCRKLNAHEDTAIMLAFAKIAPHLGLVGPAEHAQVRGRRIADWLAEARHDCERLGDDERAMRFGIRLGSAMWYAIGDGDETSAAYVTRVVAATCAPAQIEEDDRLGDEHWITDAEIDAGLSAVPNAGPSPAGAAAVAPARPRTADRPFATAPVLTPDA